MKHRHSPNNHSGQHRVLPLGQHTGSPTEFENPEALLRFDQQRTPLPESIEKRLEDTIAEQDLGPRPWWQRLFKPNPDSDSDLT